MLRPSWFSLRHRLILLSATTVAALLAISAVTYLYSMRTVEQHQAESLARKQAIALRMLDRESSNLRQVIRQMARRLALEPISRARSVRTLPRSVDWDRSPHLAFFLQVDSSGEVTHRLVLDSLDTAQLASGEEYQRYLPALEAKAYVDGFVDLPGGLGIMAGANLSRLRLSPRAPALTGCAIAVARVDQEFFDTFKDLADVDVLVYRRHQVVLTTLPASRYGQVAGTIQNPPAAQDDFLNSLATADSSNFCTAAALNDYFGQPVAYLRVLPAIEVSQRVHAQLLEHQLWLLGGSLLAVGIALAVTERWVVSPLRALQAQAHAAQKRHFSGQRIKIHRRDEFGALAKSMNTFLQREETSERRSRQAQTLLAQVVQSAEVGLIALDHQARVLMTNRRLEEILGISREEITQRGWFNVLYASTGERLAAEEQWRNLLEVSEPRRQTAQVRIEDGSRVLSLSTARLQNPDGEILGTISCCHDLTKQRQLENEVEQTRRLASLGTLAGGIAHNFNNILCSIMGFTGLGRERLQKDDPVREYFNTIEQSARRASQLTQQLLMFAKGGQGTLQLIDLRPLIHEVVSMLRETLPKNITIEENHHHNWLFCHADSGQIYQGLLNICLNARDAMPHGGRLAIDSKLETFDRSTVPSSELEPGRYIRVEISDTGTGMSNETKARIFEPFFTTKAPGRGTGLGLATVYLSIKSHRGHIEVRSEVGQGSHFILYLPALNNIFDEVATSQVAAPLTPKVVHVDAQSPFLPAEEQRANRDRSSGPIAEGADRQLRQAEE